MVSSPTASDLDVVRRINVFRGVKPLVFERLVAPAVTLTFKSGDTVFRQGDPAAAFFIVVDGWIKLYHITASGKEAVIYVFTKGESIAEAVAFTGQSYPAAAEAASDARIVRIPASHIIKCIRDTPDIALAMMASTSMHFHHLLEQIAQLKVQSAVQRVRRVSCLVVSFRQWSMHDRVTLRKNIDRRPSGHNARIVVARLREA